MVAEHNLYRFYISNEVEKFYRECTFDLDLSISLRYSRDDDIFYFPNPSGSKSSDIEFMQ